MWLVNKIQKQESTLEYVNQRRGKELTEMNSHAQKEKKKYVWEGMRKANENGCTYTQITNT